MSWLRRTIRAAAERVARRYYEGPEPPRRLAEEVRVFAILRPAASAAEWEDFTARLAENAYRDGWVRGHEARERDPEAFVSGFDPSLVEAERRRDWSLWDGHPSSREVLERGHDPRDPLAGVPPEHRAEVLRQIGEAQGTFRIVVPGEPGDGISRFRGGGDGGQQQG